MGHVKKAALKAVLEKMPGFVDDSDAMGIPGSYLWFKQSEYGGPRCMFYFDEHEHLIEINLAIDGERGVKAVS